MPNSSTWLARRFALFGGATSIGLGVLALSGGCSPAPIQLAQVTVHVGESIIVDHHLEIDDNVETVIDDPAIVGAVGGSFGVEITGLQVGDTVVRAYSTRTLGLNPAIFIPVAGQSATIPVQVLPRRTGNLDGDGDGVPDIVDGCPRNGEKSEPGICGCDFSDADSDLDGTPDCIDGCASDPAKSQPGACGCGSPDTDENGNGIADCNEDAASPTVVTLRVTARFNGTPVSARFELFAVCPNVDDALCVGVTNELSLFFECSGLQRGRSVCVSGISDGLGRGQITLTLDDLDGDGLVTIDLPLSPI